MTRESRNGLDELVFVYGTLRKDGSNSSRMAGARWVADAMVKGELYRIDWYPGIVLGGEERVIGELYEVAASYISELDAYEGEEYRRVKAPVQLDDGSRREAWIWEYLPSITGFARIVSGDWCAEMGSKK